jgi:multiple sugar transport system substrate-binding protein
MAAERSFSRRNFLAGLAGAATASVLAGCGGGGGGQPAGGGAPTAQSGGGAQAPAPTTAAAGATPGTPAQPAASGTVVVWQGLDYIPQTTQYVHERLDAVAKDKGLTLQFEELPNNASSDDRFNAAVQAGSPPDLYRVFDYQNQYWRAQGQTVDITDIVGPFAGQQGGFWEPAQLTCSYQGRWWAAPYAVNCWPFHARQDLLDANNLKWPATWDEVRAQGKQLTKPPFYYWGETLGRTNDANNHFIGLLWTFGGKLQNDDGTLAAKPGDDAWTNALALIDGLFNDDKIIPPGSVNWGDPGNNDAYQSEQVFTTSNPTSVYNWLVQNKPDLAQKTRFYSYPGGPAGSFGQVDNWGEIVMKNGKNTEGAKVLVQSLLDPTWYADYINKKLQGRFVPVYKNMLNDDLWQKNDQYTEYQKIIQTGRTMAFSSPPLAAYAEITTKYVIGDMIQDVVLRHMKPADAYNNFLKAAQEIYSKPENQPK